MGLADDYRLPARYDDAYHLLGDGVVANVVAHVAGGLLDLRVAGSDRAPLVRGAGAHGRRVTSPRPAIDVKSARRLLPPLAAFRAQDGDDSVGTKRGDDDEG
jgi:hypothetical protein